MLPAGIGWPCVHVHARLHIVQFCSAVWLQHTDSKLWQNRWSWAVLHRAIRHLQCKLDITELSILSFFIYLCLSGIAFRWVVGCWRGCLGWGADLHIAQQMPLPLTIFCSSKSRLVLPFLVLPFWYLLTRVVPDRFQQSSKNGCVCVCVRYLCFDAIGWAQEGHPACENWVVGC